MDVDEGGQIEKTSNHWYQAIDGVSQGATQSTLAVTPAMDGSRISSMSDFWRFYRAVRLIVHFQALTASSATRAGAMITFSRGQITAPATILNASQMDKAAYCFAYQTVPSKLVLKRADLIGKVANLKWWQTQGVGDLEFDTQGTLVFVNTDEGNEVAAGLSNGIQCFFEVHFEFCGRLPAGVSYERQKKRFAMNLGPECVIVVQDDEKENKKKVTSPAPLRAVAAAVKALESTRR